MTASHALSQLSYGPGGAEDLHDTTSNASVSLVLGLTLLLAEP